MRREHFEYQYGDEIEAEATRPPMLDAPLSEADAEARRRSIADEERLRAMRVALAVADDKADMRARCTVNWPREFKRAAAPVLALQQQLSANGFDARQLDPVLIALREALIQINQEMTNG